MAGVAGRLFDHVNQDPPERDHAPPAGGNDMIEIGVGRHNFAGSGALVCIERDQRLDGVVVIEAEVGVGILVGPGVVERSGRRTTFRTSAARHRQGASPVHPARCRSRPVIAEGPPDRGPRSS